MNKLPLQLAALDESIVTLGKKPSFAQARAVIDAVIAQLGVNSSGGWKPFTDSQGKIRSNAGWFMEAEGFADRRAVYKIAEDVTSNLDLKAYWTHKTKKSVISWLVALTPNFEDEPFYQNLNVGIDFIIPEKADRVIVILSKNYVIRTMELHGQLSVTQQEIFAKWNASFDFSNKAQVHETLWQSFDMEPLNKRFYKEISSLFIELEQHLTKTKLFDKRHAAYFANRLIGRIIFCWFLDKKGLINPEIGYFETDGRNATDYYHEKLETLFFKVFNAPIEERALDIDQKTPFLNGGLFEAKDGDKLGNPSLTFPADYFDRLFGFLRHYNFTTDESTSTFQQVAIDPEMLGRIFENLLAEQVEETGEQARKAKGAFYTPREIVDYMCRESLREYLKSKLPDLEDRDQRISQLLDSKEHEWRDQQRNFRQDLKNYKHDILKALDDLKVIDPACGSGAFPMGMLHMLLQAYERLEPDFDPYKKKLSIIRENLYGVDIEPMAVEISRLRAWLSIVVEEEKIEPLPNLDFKFVCANSLIPLDSKEQSNMFDDTGLDKEIQQLRTDYYSTNEPKEKSALRRKFKDLLETRSQQGMWTSEREKQLLTYDPFDSENVTEFFDPMFMFGWSAFDIVIANPPYVGEKGHKEMFRSIAKEGLGKFYQGKMDLFYFFFHLALNLGKNNSQVAFITTNYYPTASGAHKLREDFKNRAIVRKLINFNELKIFKSATGQHNMVTIVTKGQDSQVLAKTCITKRIGEASSETLNKIVSWHDDKTEYSEVAQEDLYDGDKCYIRLAGSSLISVEPVQVVLGKIKEQGTPLVEICEISNGMHTQADYLSEKKYSLREDKNAEKGDGIYVLDQNSKRDLNILQKIRKSGEVAYLKPFFKNSDIDRFYCEEKNDKYVIYINRQEDDIEKMPFIKSHLLRFKSIIEAASDNAPYLHRPKRQEFFTNSKIITPHRSKHCAFSYTDIPWYASADVYFIIEKDATVFLKYVLAILNSQLIFLWLQNRGKRKGDTLEIYQQPLSEIPIKKISEADQKPFIEIVNQILKITSAQKYDPKNPPTEQINLERKIDEMVFDLYGLTKEEKEIVLQTS